MKILANKSAYFVTGEITPFSEASNSKKAMPINIFIVNIMNGQ